MARLVGAYAASHGPLLIREWEAVPAEQKQRLSAAFAELGKRMRSARPDVLIVVSPDHWSNFFLDNYPAVCIGVGAANEGPPEPWMKAFAHRDIAGHPGLAMHIAEQAMQRDFEPALSHRLKLDHGSCIPLWRMGLEPLPQIIPLLVNSIEPPMPSLTRCYEWG
ncbi:MAG TPA: 2,3-dihydroxyphenylpropionate 1,2-dioxygenase, partial [Burkholderiales bacterium]|nr:2,3-dihydroxyphenylpropionate 1,2-dioxygenase [Burkholderiales bacterium]